MKRAFYKIRISAAWLVILLSASNFTAISQSPDHTCGAANVHNTDVTYGQVSDIDGNSYKTVIIDDLVWFAENLKVTRFQNGDVIPNISDSEAWAGLSGPGMCSYKNDTSYDCPFGKLYNFYVASDSRNPCPIGWRVPSLADLYKLIFFIDPNADKQQPGNLPNIAGGPLKSSGLTYWRSPNNNATNLSGLSAIPNGGRNNVGMFSLSSDAAASYWLSTQVGPGMGFFIELAFSQDMAVRNAYFAKYGICIRCVTDLQNVNVNDIKTTHISTYPNPSHEYIQVNSEKSMVGKEYIITDLTGRIILSGRILSEDMTISIVELPIGMYFLRFPMTQSGVSKIIKE